MLKKIGLPLMALAGVLMFAPHQAKAAVRFGVTVGAPVYRYPVYPRVYPPVYAAPVAPVYPAPVGVYPYVAWDRFGHRVVRERVWRDRDGFRRVRR